MLDLSTYFQFRSFFCYVSVAHPSNALCLAEALNNQSSIFLGGNHEKRARSLCSCAWFRSDSGFHGFQAGFTAVKRRDPLASFGSFSHSWSLSGKQAGRYVDLGNTIDFKLGTLLATSPDTSLRFAFEISRTGEAELSGRKLAGVQPSCCLS